MDLSVIMPAFNEEGCIVAAVGDVQRDVLALVPVCELIVVDDGSHDGTGEMLDQMARTEPRLRVIHEANGGHGRALRAGLENARGEFLLLIDSDRQIPTEQFARLWDLAQKGDGAFGQRRQRCDAWPRRLLTQIIRWTLRFLFAVRLHDANAPFKIIRRRVWERARPLIPPGTLTPSLFLAVFAVRRGCRIALQDVTHLPRRTGTVSIRHGRLIKFCVAAFWQLLAFRLRLRRIEVPAS
jgi:glycosyltransferase involved in cell wall biosynthesis